MMAVLKTMLSEDGWIRALRTGPGELVILSRAVHRLDGLGDAPIQEEISDLQVRLGNLLLNDNDLSGRDLKNACRVCLLAPRPLFQSTEIQQKLVKQVDAQRRRSALFALIDSYLDSYRFDDEAVDHLGKAITLLSARWAWRPLDMWPSLHARYQIFDAKNAPARIAKETMQATTPVDRILSEVGLGSEVRKKGGLAEAAFIHACHDTRNRVADAAIPLQIRLIGWGSPKDISLVFPRAWPIYASALFNPWKMSQPQDAHEKLLVDIAFRCAGDPRLQPAKWRNVQEQYPEAYATILRWLTKASFEQFFSIVDKMTDRPDMWAQRKAFWSRYLKANHIGSAWVVFGEDGAELAMRMSRQTGNEALAKFGRLAKSASRTTQHTALIMQIGDLIVVEWSHNGKWNIWRAKDKLAPKLHRFNSSSHPDYTASDLMNAPTAGMHDASGHWQYRVSEHIRQETGFRI